MTYWDDRARVYVTTGQKLAGIDADSLAGEETFTKQDPRSWGVRNLADGRELFITNPFVVGKHDGIDVFFLALASDEPIPDGYWMSWGSANKVFYPYGTKATAACDGLVKHAYYMSTGLLVILEHANTDQTGYFHGLKDTQLVSQGDSVERGQPLFEQGYDISAPLSSNNGIHQHFTVKRNGIYINPATWLQYADHLPAGC